MNYQMEDSGIDTTDNEKINGQRTAVIDKTKGKSALLDSESEFSDEDWEPNQKPTTQNGTKSTLNATSISHSYTQKSEIDKPEAGEDTHGLLLDDTKYALTKQPLPQSSPNNARIATTTRHSHTDRLPGRDGKLESSGLLVEVEMDDSDSEEDIPLSWQRSSRSMKEQLLKDGYNLDLESDNEDLDLIPPRQSYGVGGGICSCSSDSCLIS